MKHKKIFSLLIFSFVLLIIGCSDDKSTEPIVEKTLDQLYHAAVLDAMVAEENEIINTLTPIIPSNSNLVWMGEDTARYVLMLVFTKYASSYPVGDTITTWWDNTWSTAVPELKNWIKKNPVPTEKVILRTEQLLGLPHNSGNEWMVEVWVKSADLLRPAYENDIETTSSGIYFSETVTQDYITWFNGNIIYSYYPVKNKNPYPWTRLGYTFDWGNKISEVGLSEFLIKKNSRVIVKSVKSIAEYLTE